MIKTLRESKAKLSELVELASRGEDVLITVRGRVKARLTRAVEAPASRDRTRWVQELKGLHRRTARTIRPTIQEILDEQRQERS